jgi:hypothetical protein
VAPDTIELRIPVSTTDHVVKLHLRGLESGGYMIDVKHDSGRKAMDFGHTDGEHMFLLPAGNCRASIHRSLPDGTNHVVDHVFTVTDEVTQEVTWDLTAR